MTLWCLWHCFLCYYSIENDRFNIRICQSWACVHFLLGYIIQFFSFSFEIIFPLYYKGFNYQAKGNTSTVEDSIWNDNPLTVKWFPIMQIINGESFNSERNHLIVKSLFLECTYELVANQRITLDYTSAWTKT